MLQGTTSDPVHCDAVLTVPSKQLSIGDANGEHLVDVPSTKCRVQISAIPWGNATAIDVWVTVVD